MTQKDNVSTVSSEDSQSSFNSVAVTPITAHFGGLALTSGTATDYPDYLPTMPLVPTSVAPPTLDLLMMSSYDLMQDPSTFGTSALPNSFPTTAFNVQQLSPPNSAAPKAFNVQRLSPPHSAALAQPTQATLNSNDISATFDATGLAAIR